MFQACFRDDECIVIRTVLLSQGGLMSLSLGIIVIGHLLRAMFGVAWLVLLHCWVHMVVVAFGVDWGVDLFGAFIAIFTVAGLGAASAPSFWLLSGVLSSGLSPSSSVGVSTMYIPYDEVAVQRPLVLNRLLRRRPYRRYHRS